MPIYHAMNEMAQSSKRISLNFFNTEGPVVTRTADDLHEMDQAKLRNAVFAVFQSKNVDETMEELFRSVENINDEWMVISLYETLESLFTTYVRDLLPIFSDESMALNNISSAWDTYCQKMLLVRSIFLCMDQQIPMANPDFMQLWDLSLYLFRRNLMTGSVQSRILTCLLDIIHEERSGATIEKGLLRSIVRMYSDLNLYHSNFEAPFLDQTRQFYDEEGERLSQKITISDYLKHVKRRIDEEEERLKLYLSHLTRSSLISTLDTELISKRRSFLISSVSDLVIECKFEELHLLYFLLSRIENGVNELRMEFKRAVTRTGREIVENTENSPEKDKNMIHRLLDWKDTCTKAINLGFFEDPTFQRAVQESFEDFINRRQNRPAEYLAKYVDALLRSNHKAQTEDEFDNIIDKVMVLFRFLDGRDVFKAFYSNHLARRLLLCKSASIDAEKAVLSRLKHECGADYTRKMELMFHDIQLSQELSRSFRAHQNEVYTIDFSINVIAPASWPEIPELNALYPPEMSKIRTDFNQFYVDRHMGRKLTYVPYYGACVVKAHLPSCTDGKPKELQVSEVQALVLLLFNGPEDAAVSYDSIVEATGVDKTHLDRAILSLIASKSQRILISVPLSTELTSKNVFYFNKKFNHHLTRIRFNQLQLKESKEEQEETEVRINADRNSHVDCAIVRIMKSRKTLDHNALISETFKQLKFPFKQSDLKKRIETLINREFLRRDPENSAVYHYVA